MLVLITPSKTSTNHILFYSPAFPISSSLLDQDLVLWMCLEIPYWRLDSYSFWSPIHAVQFCMAVMEAHTSSSVKDLIIAVSGVEDKDWEGSYSKPTGGILTVHSELGEPIHKVATHGVKLKKFNDTVFKEM